MVGHLFVGIDVPCGHIYACLGIIVCLGTNVRGTAVLGTTMPTTRFHRIILGTFWFAMPPALAPMLHLTWHSRFTMAAGAVASQADDQKKVYLEGHPGICFTPITYETSGVVGPLSLIFLKELGHRLSATTVDTKNYSYLLQRLSVAIQSGNAASIIGTLFPLPVLTFRGGGGV